MIKLIALDLDGTLTNDDKIITPRTVAALQKAQQLGVQVCLASGRPPYGMRPLAPLLHPQTAAQTDNAPLPTKQGNGVSAQGSDYPPIILLCYNGGHIEYDTIITNPDGTVKKERHILVEKELDKATIPMLKDFQERSGMTLMTYYEDKIYTEHPDDPYVAVSSRNNRMQVVGIHDFSDFATGKEVPACLKNNNKAAYASDNESSTSFALNKCLMVGDPEKVRQWEPIMQAAFAPDNKQQQSCHLNIMHSTPYFIECLPPGIDKGLALEAMLPQLGLKREELMTFGDSFNDIGMIKYAGIGVAMANADEEVKAIADYVTDSNNDDGIATAIEKYIFNC